jgi:hypothetical protein
MDQQHARWATPLAFLLLNLVGWVIFYFAAAGPAVREREAPDPSAAERDALARSVEARLAAVEAQLQKVGDRIDVLATRSQAPRDDVAQRLSQAELKRLESTTARLEDELASLGRRTHVTVDLNGLVQRLRPNVSFGLLRIAPTKPGVFDLTFQTRNLGVYAATVELQEIALAATPFTGSGPAGDLLVPSQDYTVKALRAAETLLPNEARNLAYTVVLNDPRRLERPLHYKATFRTSTDPTVVATSSGLLKGKLPEKDIRALSVSDHTDLGEVTAGSHRSTP